MFPAKRAFSQRCSTERRCKDASGTASTSRVLGYRTVCCIAFSDNGRIKSSFIYALHRFLVFSPPFRCLSITITMAFCQIRRRAFSLGTNCAFLIKPRIPLERIVRGFSAQLPLEARRLEGKVAIITGGASGFGEATARTFVAHGAKVVIGDTDDEQGGRVSASLHPHAHFLHCNVAQEEDVSGLVDLAVSRHGHLDIMFNNAGIPGRGFGTPAEMSIEDFQRVMDVNVRGVVSGVKHAARAMMERNKGGSILCTASIASVLALRSSPAYTISKHAVVGIVKSAASELAPYGIRVNCVSPYAVLTPLVLNFVANVTPNVVNLRETTAECIERSTDFRGTTLEEEDVAKAALFLSSDDARYISGHNLVIDGAFTSSKPLILTKMADW